jgi:hypothetical protein
MAQSTVSTQTSSDQLGDFIGQVRERILDPRTTPAEERRLREIAADAIATSATAAKSALCVAILLATLTGQAIAAPSPSAPRQGAPDCLNEPDKNGARPGCY